MLNEDLNNQTDELFSDTKNILEDYKSGKKKPVPMSEVFTLENVKKNLLPQFRTKEEIIDKAKATGTGLLTGTLAIPSDLVTLSSAVASGVAKYSDNPTAMMLKDVLQKAEKEVGREAFDKWFTETTGIESNPDNVDQLIGEILSPTGAFLAPVKTLKKVFAPLKKGVTDFFDKMPPPDGGLALETAGATKPVDELDQTKKLLDQEKAVTTNIPSSIPADEIINAPRINPTMAGKNTDTGKKQAKLFEELEAKGNTTPETLFQETGVYRGEDGKLRYEIDDRNAEFVKGFKPKSGEDYALYKVLKFDDLYKEYGKDLTVGGRRYGSLRNIRVNFIRDTDNYLGKYEPNIDAITINLSKESNKDPEKMISTLLHEIQHAVQRREGFTTGTSPETQLIESPNYDDYLKAKSYVENRTIRDKKTGVYVTPAEASKKQIAEDELIDDIPPNTFISNDRRNQHVNQLNSDIRVYNAFLKTKDLQTRNRLKENIAKQMLSKKISVKEAAELDPAILAKETYDFLIKDIRNITGKSFDEAEKYISRYRDVIEKERKASELMKSEEAIARQKYYDKYGEREANLVQQRYERRLKYKKIYGEVSEMDMRLETDFLKGEQSDLGQMGGFGSREKKRLDKLKRTDPVTGKVKPKIAIDIPAARGNRIESSEFNTNINENLHDDLNTEELIAGYIIEPRLVNADGTNAPSTKTAVSRAELATRLQSDNAFQKASNKALDDKGYGDTVPIFRVITNKQDTMNLNNEQLVSGLLDKNKILKLHEYLTAGKRTIDDESYLLKYNVPRNNVLGYLPAYKDKIKRNINKKIKEKGIGQKKISGFETVTNPSEFTKSLMNAQDEIIADVGNIKPEVFTTEGFGAKGEPFNLNVMNRMFIDEIIKDNINKPKDLMTYKPGFSFTKDVKRIEDIVPPIKDKNSQQYIDEVKKFFDIKKMAKGGDMKKQMELFQEGGLKDEGNTVDPISGNDVPPGATQEEVRDDIPAQLSEGEFVFPADVVRYIGLEKLMQMRQKAKAGLARMEEMGQMGNSEEATVPDDAPFSIEDLDMEEETEYNQGGVVKAQTGTYVAPGTGVIQPQTPNMPTTGISSYTAPPIPPATPAPVGGFTPQFYNQQDTQGTAPSFETLVGRNPGQYDEFREYVNEAGMKLQIPFKDGQPIYPIPEGYTFVDPEEVKVVDPKVTDVKPQTTRVTEESSDDSDTTTTSAVDLAGDPFSYKSMFNMDALDKTMKDIAFSQLNLFDAKAAISRGIGGNINVGNLTLDRQKQVMETYKKGLPNEGKGYNLVNLPQEGRDLLAEKLNNVKQEYEDVLTDKDGKGLSMQGLVDKFNRLSRGIRGVDKILTMEDVYIKDTNIINKTVVDNIVGTISAEAKREKEAAKQVKEMETSPQGQDTFGKGVGDPLGLDFGSSYESSDYDTFTGERGQTVDPSDEQQAGGSFVGDDPAFKQGGLASKKKTKVKKMKRGGLASR